MTHCEYWDAGWCYSPKGVKNNASSSGACLDPDYCPHIITKECRQTGRTNATTNKLLKLSETQMTNEIDITKVLIDGDTATIMGVKYQRIIEPQSFYDKIYGLLDDNLIEWVDTNNITIRVLDLIRENIPEPYKGVGLPEYSVGWNECVERIKNNLK